jgi:hypothetical protein
VFTFSGFNLLHFMHVNAIAVVAHIPWLLLAIDVLLRGADPRHTALALAVIALGTGSQLLIGHPQFVWLSVVGEASFAAWRLPRAISLWRFVLLAWAIGLGILLGGIQLVPTMQALAESERSNPSPEFRTSYSLPVANLLQLVSPYGFKGRVVGGNVQEFGLYNGATCSVAIGWLLLRGRALGRWRSLIVASVAFSAVMVLLSLGPSGVIYDFVTKFPGIGVFRAPARYILLLHMAMAIIAAVMMADLLRLARRLGRPRRLRTVWPLGLVPGLSVAALIVHTWIQSDPFRYKWSAHLWPISFAAVGTVLILAATLFVVAAFRGARWAPWCLAVFTVADLTLWGHSFIWREPPQSLAQLMGRFPKPPGAPQDGRVHVSGGMDWLYGDVLVMRGYRLASGYVGLRPTRILSPDEVIGQRLLGVHWVFRDGRWGEVPDPLPRVRLVTDAVVTSEVPRSLGTIDVRRAALVSQPVGDLGPRAEGTAKIIRDEPGLIEIRTVNPDRLLLVLSEAYSPGWRAAEDGHETPIYRAYGDLQACVTSPGTHRIVFRFAPASFDVGRWLSGGGLVLLAVSLAASGPLVRRARARSRSGNT